MNALLQKAEQAYSTGLQVLLVLDLANYTGLASTRLMPNEPLDDLIESIEDGRGYHESVKPFAKLVIESEIDRSTNIIDFLQQVGRYHPELLGLYLCVSVPRKDRPGIHRLQWTYGTTYEEAYQHAVEWAE